MIDVSGDILARPQNASLLAGTTFVERNQVTVMFNRQRDVKSLAVMSIAYTKLLIDLAYNNDSDNFVPYMDQGSGKRKVLF